MKISPLEWSQRASQFQPLLLSWSPEAKKSFDLSVQDVKVWDKKETSLLSSFIEEEQKKWNVPGVVVLILQNQEVVFSKGFGVRKKGEKEKVDEKTPFMIGSVTKPLTTLL